MVEHEKSLDEYIKDIVRNERVDEVMETLWLEESVKSSNEKSEEVEKIIYEKVEKYVTEEGFPNKGTNKEDIIKDMMNSFVGKTIAPVTEQVDITNGLFVDFLKNYKVLLMHRKGAKMKAEELSNRELKKMFDEITSKEKGETNE